VIDITVNGRDLGEIVREVERPFASAEGAPNIAGTYLGLPPTRLDDSPSNHFLDSAQSRFFCGPRRSGRETR
jgi:hypothetical protein